MRFNLHLIIDFFQYRNWTIVSEGNLFLYLKPPKDLQLPKDFLFEIPKDNTLKGFDNYIIRFINNYSNIFLDTQEDELELLFSEKASVLKYRIFDSDNNDGTISLNKFVKSMDTFRNVLQNTVSFTVNKKQIFGYTQIEATEYLKNCRVMQSAKGSFVNRLEIKSKPLNSTMQQITTDEVNAKLFDVLEFVKEDVIVNRRPIISENYIADNAELINYELLRSIKTIYQKSYISNIEYTLEGNFSNRIVSTEKMMSKINHFESYLKSVKTVLENLNFFEITGFVINLTSHNPTKSERNEVILDSRKFGYKKPIKFYLKSEEYLDAMEAHKNHFPIKIKGKAIEYKTGITIQNLENFEIIKPQ
jgi:hypothetical protein